MSAAKKFIKELQAGNLTEAIEAIKSNLQEKAQQQIAERRQATYTELGFAAVTEKSTEKGKEGDGE